MLMLDDTRLVSDLTRSRVGWRRVNWVPFSQIEADMRSFMVCIYEDRMLGHPHPVWKQAMQCKPPDAASS